MRVGCGCRMVWFSLRVVVRRVRVVACCCVLFVFSVRVCGVVCVPYFV